ncbi:MULTISPECIES: 3-oxoacyl-ACP synthase [Paraburkholderia]|jgi:3-oxoacyl-[acyl-carrier-protein] synthase III|uniref:3-oxoacyl-[acyl-carrier-protein] synthase III n=1 Tax=Paraburkholderia fungorum TaxID=134537 RepID=A0AAW3UYC6_9BURK|nr:MULTISPECIES: 3-oxoacyl-ACP synthase [Paraburkholderia]KFX64352.1 3-oxoacyl-ACP synthase [Burkholderia sp. K24]MBB4515396.1 3-oxoacyl-[acyl-carrier-protein] synthase III [Paraburkholderia fungorum]MBB6203339.1 3-oxoacyl-[acyl-carrier-protein] synthase III [Paraburkholderia fungorum]MDE1011676.1 3-oxoacyl-ACP synthase [Paraburkholderia fungorum]USU14742.1 3-oxoacyl-ACP synthase [Paraburkholderia fungorum]
MKPPVITAVTAWVPDALPLSRWTAIESSLRATGHPGWDAWMRSWHPDYGHWLEAWPGVENAGSPPVHLAGLVTPEMNCKVPVETVTDLSGLAAKVTKAICHARPPHSRPVEVIVFCHSSLDEHVSTTIAGRLCAEVGTPCFPFSISQQHGVSPFTALRIASDLFIAEPDIHTILIVAAEKWRPPFSRMCGPGIVHGDAAGALLIERNHQAGANLQLLDAVTRQVPVDIGTLASGIPDAPRFALVSMIEFLLARHDLRHEDIHEVIGHPGTPSLTRAVGELLNRPDARVEHAVCVHLGAAESIVRLAQALTRATGRQRRRLLLWSYGTRGFIGTALLELCGTPSLYWRDGVRSVS